jgi:hypothetical protein
MIRNTALVELGAKPSNPQDLVSSVWTPLEGEIKKSFDPATFMKEALQFPPVQISDIPGEYTIELTSDDEDTGNPDNHDYDDGSTLT